MVRPMRTRWIWTVLAAGLVFGPLPARAAAVLDLAEAGAEQSGAVKIAAKDKEKPSKPKEKTKEEKKKKYDDFKDENGNGIDDRYEKKEPPKRGKKEKPEEVTF